MTPAKPSSLYRLLLGGLLALACSATANAWWNNEWTVRKQLTIDATPTGVEITEPIGTAPLLVRLYDGNFQFTAAKEDGSDIRFVAADDKTPLAYHIERFDPLLNEAFVWVQVPNIKPKAKTTLWLYYGNPGAKAETVDTKATYDNDTLLVYHFAKRGQSNTDASGHGTALLNADLVTEGALIGAGLRLDGKTVAEIPPTPALAWQKDGAFTWSAWVKFAAAQPSATIFSRRDGNASFRLGADEGQPFVEIAYGSVLHRSEIAAGLPLSGWHHLALLASGPTVTLYIDGARYAALNVGLPALDTVMTLGGEADAKGDVHASGFVGELDELQCHKGARSPGYIEFSARSQMGGDATAKFLAFTPDEQAADPLAWLKGGYFGIIISSLTTDGWVVIGLLSVMAAVSWFVMVGKGSYLNAISKGNALFMKEWDHVSSDLSVLDEDSGGQAVLLGGRVNADELKAMHNTPLYRIYHIGASEIRKRVAQERSGGKVVSARSIQAIRASLDGGLVREIQKLNKGMVLLTIAISGGPFLGLLGTVVGVMITFAAVSAAGEVNVNAIAPGIAAALLATVAGLAVAIPALFGYNYLLTRVKETTSDLHVFIDEFVTKMAEFYSEEAHKERTQTGSAVTGGNR